MGKQVYVTRDEAEWLPRLASLPSGCAWQLPSPKREQLQRREAAGPGFHQRVRVSPPQQAFMHRRWGKGCFPVLPRNRLPFPSGKKHFPWQAESRKWVLHGLSFLLGWMDGWTGEWMEKWGGLPLSTPPP